jgi:hypothetical protein
MRSLWLAGGLACLALAGCTGPTASAIRYAQEDHACAELGFAPGTARFENCSRNLESALTEQELFPK